MPFAFLPTDPSLASAVLRVAGEEAQAALAQVEAEGELGPRVHAMRKSVKKLRGLLRLVRPVMREARAENAALAEAGRGLSSLRDAAVVLATAEGIAEGMEEGRREALLAPLREAARAHDEAAGEAMLPAFAADLAALRGRMEGWRVKGRGWDGVSPGLEATWRAARGAMAEARDEPTPDATHEWRKRVKDHWYQARLLQHVWPEVMGPHVEAADRLGEVLGQVNDLAVLRGRLEGAEASLRDEALALAEARRAQLWAEAEPLGRRLLAGKATDLSRRWGAWWRLGGFPAA